MNDKRITIIVAEACSDDYYEDGTFDLSQKSYMLDELFGEAWFKDLLKDKGFYQKDDLANDKLIHLNNFLYVQNDDNKDYAYAQKNLKDISHWNMGNFKVYQEVIGPERLKEVAKLKEAYEKYLRRQELIKQKAIANKEKIAERRKLKQIEKAKKILSESGNV